MKQYLGEIVRAKVLDRLDDSVYKLKVRIEGGHLKGEECYVARCGNTKIQDSDIVVRLWKPNQKSNLNLNNKNTAYFASLDVPYSFEVASSANVLFYAILYDRMKGEYEVPHLELRQEFFYLGPELFSLHYTIEKDLIVPYNLFYNAKPEKMVYYSDRNRTDTVMSIGDALNKFLKKYKKLRRTNSPDFPREITIDEKIVDNQENTGLREILNEFDKTEMIQIEMEPQN